MCSSSTWRSTTWPARSRTRDLRSPALRFLSQGRFFRYTTPVRKLLSLLLLAVFSLPLLLPALALAQGPESNLPACCRRNGAHHCMMSAEQMQRLLNGIKASAPHSHCPLYPAAITPLRHVDLAAPTASPALTSILRVAMEPVHTETRAIAAPDNTHHPRGPPYSSVL